MLKAVYLTKEAIPAQYVDLYTEKNGQWELTGIEGIRTEADIERITDAYGKRIKDAAKSVKSGEGLTSDQIAEIVRDEIKKAAGDGGGNNGGGDNNNGGGSDLERQLAAATDEAQTWKGKAEAAEAAALDSNLTAQLTAAVTAAGVRPEAVDHFVTSHKSDFELRDGKLARKFVESDPKTATQSVDDYLTSRKTDKSTAYFWPGNEGGGSGGSGGLGGAHKGPNPFDPKTANMTEQNRIYSENPELAKRLADQAGVDVLTGQPKTNAA